MNENKLIILDAADEIADLKEQLRMQELEHRADVEALQCRIELLSLGKGPRSAQEFPESCANMLSDKLKKYE